MGVSRPRPGSVHSLRLVGGAYLVYVGVQAIRRRNSFDLHDASTEAPGITGRRAFVSGCLTNLLSPKMVVFTVALLPQFVWGYSTAATTEPECHARGK